MNKIEIELVQEKVTPGAIKYRAQDSEGKWVDQRDVAVSSVYIRKDLLPKNFGQKIKITVEAI